MPHVMLALDAAARKRASHLPNTPEDPWLPASPLMPSGMHQGKRQAPSWAIGLPPSKTKVTARQKCRHGPIKEVYN
jgi:hypothetical protein